MDELEWQKAEIIARMAQIPTDVPDIHPNIANAYRLRIERFTEALNDPEGGRQAAETLRSLIGEIVLTPGAKRGEVHAELRGRVWHPRLRQGRRHQSARRFYASSRNQRPQPKLMTLSMFNQALGSSSQGLFCYLQCGPLAARSGSYKYVLARS
ncbi:hypothetical protein [Phyllobacterium salinisoli]|uniref:hypothetical protein n=1 Tax=Phyllobacterium salinisoli TaxID=1899321 RepID=UPI00190F9FD5|nr:hypothetical protein [Phyllobacterium salinisoli]